MIGDVTSSALHSALSGLAQRQRVTADNIANLQTPGFLAGRVDFESGLRYQLALNALDGKYNVLRTSLRTA